MTQNQHWQQKWNHLCFRHRVRCILYRGELVGEVEAVLLAWGLQDYFAVPEYHESRVAQICRPQFAALQKDYTCCRRTLHTAGKVSYPHILKG